VGPAGLEFGSEEGGDRLAVAPGKCLLDLSMRDRLAAAVAPPPFFPWRGMPVDRGIDSAALPVGTPQTSAR